MPHSPTGDDPRPHYAAKVTDLPPSEIVCACGQVFDGADPISQIGAHMDELNPAEP
jgi:hypothetical protein